MMTQQLQVSILAAPLAAIDRRTLSQAWYTALRCGQRSARTPAARGVDLRREGAAVTTRRGPCIAPLGTTNQSATACGFFERRGASVADSESPLRRSNAAPRPLAKAIEEAFCNPAVRPRRATFSMGRGSARVHVLLHSNGSAAALVALCPTAYSAQVSRALAQARRSLAARGVVADLHLREEKQCFSTLQ
ncbi:MAG: hypothetical protein JO078_11175 [Candidatus Eremiobacteraeota bacterium]|nr:hypothetical protein [Candidatus Eremiobacteraeota bacterium]MBV9055826.1 hypothetical protein [Candidatus Eremiobacteraeota bacterium]MBV9700670.1 hypothetical protein [Candidatus Eremiobacteraeota bacterium]